MERSGGGGGGGAIDKLVGMFLLRVLFICVAMVQVLGLVTFL